MQYFIELASRQIMQEHELRAVHGHLLLPPELSGELLAELGFAAIEDAPLPALAPGETLEYGDVHIENGQALRGWVIIPAPPATSTDVDTERDRRISAGFEFQGVRYQSRLPSASNPGDWDVFSGKALEALIAIMAGAQPGDLRWSDPAADFAWIAADNSRVPMDAQTVIELGKAAAAHRSAHTFAGSDLKAMATIPADYTADHWWPAEV